MHRLTSLFTLMLVVLFAASGLAAVVGFDPPMVRTDDFHCADETFVVKLVVDGTVAKLQGFSATFRFNPEVMQVVSVRAGEVLSDQPAPIFFYPFETGFATGTVQIDAAVLGTTCVVPGVDGAIDLAVIEFAKPGCGDSPCDTALELVHVDFRNNENRGIEMDVADGSVEIRPCSLPVEYVSWGRIKALLHRQ